MLTDPPFEIFLVNLDNILFGIYSLQESEVVYDNSTCFFALIRIKTAISKLFLKNLSQFFYIKLYCHHY